MEDFCLKEGEVSGILWYILTYEKVIFIAQYNIGIAKRNLEREVEMHWTQINK